MHTYMSINISPMCFFIQNLFMGIINSNNNNNFVNFTELFMPLKLCFA